MSVKILFEHYKRPPSTLSRFVTKLLQEEYGRKIRFYRLIRYASLYAYDKDRFLACNIYVGTRGFYALCVGDFSLLEEVRKKQIINYVICEEGKCPEGETVRVARTFRKKYLLVSI